MSVPPKVLSAALLGAVLLSGCTGGGDSTASSDSAGGSAAGEAALAPAMDGSAVASAMDGAAPTTVADLRVAPGAAVIRTADLQVRVDDVRAAADEAARLARAAGGLLEAEDRTGSGEDGSATVQLRVPPAELDDVVADLAALGDERSRRLSSEDVTDAVVDLEARLATQRASVDRVRALLGQADELGEVVLIEGELTRRTADLESLQARLEALTAQVDLSTITVRFDSEGGPVVGAALGFGDGLRGGWAALSTTGRVLAVTAGALLPFLPVLLVGGYLAVRARSRRTAAASA